MLLLSLNQKNNNNTTVTQSLYSPLVKFRVTRSETHLGLVFGAKSALAIVGYVPGRNHSYLLYWHAAVSRQRSRVTPTAFPVLSSNLRPCVGSALASASSFLK